MPGPFPGMDPYLEDPLLWLGVQQDLITYAKASLNAMLPPDYAARTGERTHFESDEVREVYLEILALREGERVVTTIEVLSYTNKAPGEGRRLYLSKQQEILSSRVHLIEIDLLRSGEHTLAPPRRALLAKGRWDYVVSLHRGGRGERYEVWAIALRDRLPRILVPLGEREPDMVLDLQAVLDRAYDDSGYARSINHGEPPVVPLSAEDAEWAASLLGRRGG